MEKCVHGGICPGCFSFLFFMKIVKFISRSLSLKKQTAEKVGLCESELCYEITKAEYEQYKYYILYYIKKLHTNYEWSLLYTTI